MGHFVMTSQGMSALVESRVFARSGNGIRVGLLILSWWTSLGVGQIDPGLAV